MATLKANIPATWVTLTDTTHTSTNLWDKFNAFADGQEKRKTAWFFLALIVQGVFFLPLPAALLYYFNAPIIVLAVTLACFFTTIISYMGGAGIRSVLLISAASILIQIAMALLVIAI